jgi:hypothetical protein
LQDTIKQIESRAYFLADKIIVEDEYLTMNKTLLPFAIVGFLRRLYHLTPSWPPEIAAITGVTEESIRNLLMNVHRIYEKAYHAQQHQLQQQPHIPQGNGTHHILPVNAAALNPAQTVRMPADGAAILHSPLNRFQQLQLQPIILNVNGSVKQVVNQQTGLTIGNHGMGQVVSGANLAATMQGRVNAQSVQSLLALVQQQQQQQQTQQVQAAVSGLYSKSDLAQLLGNNIVVGQTLVNAGSAQNLQSQGLQGLGQVIVLLHDGAK